MAVCLNKIGRKKSWRGRWGERGEKQEGGERGGGREEGGKEGGRARTPARLLSSVRILEVTSSLVCYILLIKGSS